jgi:hypothetical protein
MNLDEFLRWSVVAAARVEGEYIRALSMPPPLMWLLSFDPRALYEPYPLPIPSLSAKDPVGTIGDDIDEESCLERQLLQQSAGHTTSHGRMKHCLLF